MSTSVYRYYDNGGVLLYVGITDRGVRRNREHNATKDWWRFVSGQKVEHFPTRNAAESRERELIQQFRPPFNIQHNPSHEHARRTYLKLIGDPQDAITTLRAALAAGTSPAAEAMIELLERTKGREMDRSERRLAAHYMRKIGAAA